MATRLINHRAPLLLAIVAAAAMLAACGGDKGDKASQTAAKVMIGTHGHPGLFTASATYRF